MLTPVQQKWIDSLSTDRIVSIIPYDPRSKDIFNKIKEKIHSILGPQTVVEHCGASSLRISGQDEIDVSIVTSIDKFDEYIHILETSFGPVQSRYEDRARFKVFEEEKKIDLKIVDQEHPNHKDSIVFENHLRNNPKDLERYKILKEKGGGMMVREYYRQKVEFINEVLSNIN